MTTSASNFERIDADRDPITSVLDAAFGTEYRPAIESRTRNAALRFGSVEDELECGWGNAKGNSKLAWSKAASASRDAWIRIEQAMPGDTDSDGR